MAAAPDMDATGASALPAATPPTQEAELLLRFLSELGHVLIASGEAVAVIEDLLRRIARAHGTARVSVVAFPTVLFVMLETLLPTVASFVVAALALAMVKYGIPASPLRVLIASLVTFLPGGRPTS